MNSEKAWEGGGDMDIVFASMCIRRHFWVVSKGRKAQRFRIQTVKKYSDWVK